jgi:hypothetical protein
VTAREELERALKPVFDRFELRIGARKDLKSSAFVRVMWHAMQPGPSDEFRPPPSLKALATTISRDLARGLISRSLARVLAVRRKPAPTSDRIMVRLGADLHTKLHERAKALGLDDAAHVRKLIEADANGSQDRDICDFDADMRARPRGRQARSLDDGAASRLIPDV